MPPLHNHLIDKLAVLNGLISGIALYPQVYEVLVNGTSNPFLGITLFLIFLNNLVWLIYGIHRLLISLMLAASLNMIASIILLVI